MATSGTYNFELSIDDLLTEAWERCGKSSAILNGDVAVSAMRSVQLILLDWTNRGLNLWQVAREDVILDPEALTFTTPAGTVDILNMYLTVNGADYTMAAIGRSEYVTQADKTTKGRPTQFWVDRLIPEPVVFMFPVPDQPYSLTYYRIRRPQDVSTLMQTADAPVLWADTLASELAARLAIKFAPDRAGMLRQEADRSYANAVTENRERVPLMIKPAFWGR